VKAPKNILFYFVKYQKYRKMFQMGVSDPNEVYTRVYPKVSGLAACSENCKWYSFLPLGALVSLCE
jgi:hypothetical protein